MNMNNKTFGNPNLTHDIIDQLKSKFINHDEKIILHTNNLIFQKK